MEKNKLLRITIGLIFIAVIILESHFHGIHSLLMKRLDSATKNYFGEETELVDAGESMHIYHTYSAHEPKKDVFFWAIGKNFLENNLPEQMMKIDAFDFWANKDWDVLFASSYEDWANIEKTTLEETAKTAADAKSLPMYLSFSVASKEELFTCAAEMEKWMIYALEDDRYFLTREPGDGIWKSPLHKFQVRTGDRSFWIDFSHIWTGKEVPYNFTETLAELMEQEYDELFPPDFESEALEEISKWEKLEQEQNPSAEWNELYDEELGAECILENGNISYRLIAVNRDMWENYYVLIKSTDGGKTWLEINAAPFGDTYYGEVEINFQDENHGSIAGIYSDMEVNQYKKNIYVTEDGGKTFVLTEEGQPR